MDIINSMENLNIDSGDGVVEHVNEHHDEVLRTRVETDQNISRNENTKREVEMLDVKTEAGVERSRDNDSGKIVPNEEKENTNLTLSGYTDTYTLENFKQNLLVIFNHVYVIGYQVRIGTEKDVEKLTKTFEKFGFIVITKTDLTKDEILEGLNEFANKDFTDYGCVAVAVLTHGSSKGKLKTKNGEEYSESEIMTRLNSGHVSLIHKPKIIIIQACRGDEYSKEISVDQPLSNKQPKINGSEEDDKTCCLLVSSDDILVIHSAYPGKAAARTEYGTWLIQTLCNKINSLADTEDLESILIHVKRTVAMKRKKKYISGTLEIIKQMPVITSTLTRKLYLRKYQEHVYERFDSDDYNRLKAWAQHMTQSHANFRTATEQVSYPDTPENFFKFVTNELNWLKEKEEVELCRDWADPQINLSAVEIYYQQLMLLFEKRELQFKYVIKLGEVLIAQDSTLRATIESQLQKMRSQWESVYQLMRCLGIHLKHTTQYYRFFQAVKRADEIICKCEEELNNSFSPPTKEQICVQYQRWSDIEDRLHKCKDDISKLKNEANNIRSIKLRKSPGTRSFKAEILATYNYADLDIEEGSKVNVLDNSDIKRWRVSLEDSKIELIIPGAIVAVQPGNQKAVDTVEKLRIIYERVWQLLLRKERILKQNDMFNNIKFVKELDFPSLIAMGVEERQRIRQALNNKANKFREKYNVDPRTRRLFSEIDEVNKLLDECNRRDPAYSMKLKGFTELSSFLYEYLEYLNNEFYEKFVISRDPDAVLQLILWHEDWKGSLLRLSNDVRDMEDRFKAVNLSQQSSSMKTEFDNVMDKWNRMRRYNEILVPMLTNLKTLVNNLEENDQTIYEFEKMLTQFNELPSHVDLLEEMYNEYTHFNRERINIQQNQINQMHDDFEKFKYLVQSIIPQSTRNSDKLKDLDKEILEQKKRWINVCQHLNEGCQRRDAAFKILSDYTEGLQKQKTTVESISNEFHNIDLLLEKQFEHVWKLLTNMMELTPEIEKVNENGSKFIKEAKIHATRCQSYVEWLKEIDPLLNTEDIRRQADILRAERLRSKGMKLDTELLTGWKAVEKELDELNLKYHELLSMLNEKAKSIAAAHPEDCVHCIHCCVHCAL